MDESRWQRLFATEGYRRLKARETSMGRSFEDSTFRAFLLSDTLLARASELERTLKEWKRVRLDAPAARVLSYLPAGARLGARVYLLVKPRPNSFVFEAATNPAIMLYLDPARSAAELENTIAHELHHIGLSAACPERPSAGLPMGTQQALVWAGAFGARIETSDPKVEHPHELRVVLRSHEHHVLGLDVPVDDPARVRHAERLGDGQDDRQGLARCDPPLGGQLVTQVRAVQQLLDQEERAVVGLLPHVQHVDDVRVLDLRRALGLLEDPPDDILAPGDPGAQQLEGHAAPGPGVLGLVDGPHSAAAQNT